MAWESNNPALSDSKLDELSAERETWGSVQVMTAEGIMQKVLILVGVTMLTAMLTIAAMFKGLLSEGMLIGGSIVVMLVTLILAFVIAYNPLKANVLAPVYAVFEGFTLGAFTGVLEFFFQGIGFTAVMLTFCLAFGCLAVYRAHIFRAELFNANTAFILLIGIAGVLACDTILYWLFGFDIGINGSGITGILASIVLLCMFIYILMVDFHRVGDAIERKLPQDYEWYFAYSILLTLILIYLEILKLMAKSRSRK